MTYNLNELDINIINRKSFSSGITFSYQDNTYYYKQINPIEKLYNELIAEKIANKLNIVCCKYNIAEYYDNLGVISEVFDKEHYLSMSDFLSNNYNDITGKNNIASINKAINNSFSKETSKKLQEELLRIFLFDVLIGNCDRNTDNYGLIIDDNPRFAPLFDNENMLSDYAIYDGNYTLEIDEDDYNNEDENLLYKLLDKNEHTKDLLKEMLPIISEESLLDIFNELELENDINPYIKETILNRFSINRNMLKSYYKQKVKRAII